MKLPPSFILFCLLSSLHLSAIKTYGQSAFTYSVYKLENKIGTEKVTVQKTATGVIYTTVIQTSDRGAKLALSANIKLREGEPFAYLSHGNTSRFSREAIDTAFTTVNSFPVSNSGSIQMKELLVDYWLKHNRPPSLTSVLDQKVIEIRVLDTILVPVTNEKLTVLELIKGKEPNEILWITAEGRAVFFATVDGEGDKREIISDTYQNQLGFLNKKSTFYLLRTYKERNKNLGNSYMHTAIIGGNIIDIMNQGNLIENCMILLKNGKIDYIGKIDRLMIPAGALVINAANQFIIPGLWDMHVHTFHPEGLKKSLHSGVTTMRDMANEFDFINQVEVLTKDPALPSPALYRAGVIEGTSPDGLGNMRAGTSAEIAAKVKLYHAAGFNQIKVYSKVSRKNIAIIDEQAQLYQMDVVGHTPDVTTLKYCVENGMKIISHVHYFMNSLKWKNSDFINENQALIDLLKNKGVAVDATLNVYSGYEPYKMKNYQRVTKFLFDHGIPIVAGTDNGSIADELGLLVDAGLTPLDAIRAATIVPARVMKADAQSGSIAKGKNADLLILSANPLIHIKNIKKISTVVKGTFIINPDTGD
jgi:imidazolonepropionase-like amidohydrolase